MGNTSISNASNRNHSRLVYTDLVPGHISHVFEIVLQEPDTDI